MDGKGGHPKAEREAWVTLNPRSAITPAFHHLGNHLEIRAAALELAVVMRPIYLLLKSKRARPYDTLSGHADTANMTIRTIY